MKKLVTFISLLFWFAVPCLSQTVADESTFKLALPSHNGQLQWSAPGFKVVESSAKPNGQEIGIRGRDADGRLTFLGFLFLVTDKGPLTSSKCQDNALTAAQKSNPRIRILATSQIVDSADLPIQVVEYSSDVGHGKTIYSTRGFTATGDTCGDLEFYRAGPVSSEDPELKKILGSLHLDMSYAPQFSDVFTYASILYRRGAFKAAAPIFEQALSQLGDRKDRTNERRVTTDEAGMAYGISGNISKARAIFEAAIVKDPDYPFYYYNLACADAEEGKLADARVHLHQAFARKANVIPGESIPDPSKDDSFLPYRSNKDFWTFIETLH